MSSGFYSLVCNFAELTELAILCYENINKKKSPNQKMKQFYTQQEGTENRCCLEFLTNLKYIYSQHCWYLQVNTSSPNTLQDLWLGWKMILDL